MTAATVTTGVWICLTLGVAVLFWRMFWRAWREVNPRRAALLDGSMFPENRGARVSRSDAGA